MNSIGNELGLQNLISGNGFNMESNETVNTPILGTANRIQDLAGSVSLEINTNPHVFDIGFESEEPTAMDQELGDVDVFNVLT